MNSFVYIMRAGGFVKIGMSSNPDKRRADLQTSNPETVSLVAVASCASRAVAGNLEKRLHKLFHKDRVNGEWFNDCVLDKARGIHDVRWVDSVEDSSGKRKGVMVVDRKNVCQYVGSDGVVVTKEFIEKHRTDRGAWTRAQIESLGISWPPTKGWKKRMVGIKISPLSAVKFQESSR